MYMQKNSCSLLTDHMIVQCLKKLSVLFVTNTYITKKGVLKLTP